MSAFYYPHGISYYIYNIHLPASTIVSYRIQAQFKSLNLCVQHLVLVSWGAFSCRESESISLAMTMHHPLSFLHWSIDWSSWSLLVLEDQLPKGKIMVLGDDQSHTQSLNTHSGLGMYNTPAFARLKNTKPMHAYITESNSGSWPGLQQSLPPQWSQGGVWIQSEGSQSYKRTSWHLSDWGLFVFIVHRYFWIPGPPSARGGLWGVSGSVLVHCRCQPSSHHHLGAQSKSVTPTDRQVALLPSPHYDQNPTCLCVMCVL